MAIVQDGGARSDDERDAAMESQLIVPNWLHKMLWGAAGEIPAAGHDFSFNSSKEQNMMELAGSLLNDRAVRMVLQSALERARRRVLANRRNALLDKAEELEREAEQLREDAQRPISDGEE